MLMKETRQRNQSNGEIYWVHGLKDSTQLFYYMEPNQSLSKLIIKQKNNTLWVQYINVHNNYVKIICLINRLNENYIITLIGIIPQYIQQRHSLKLNNFLNVWVFVFLLSKLELEEYSLIIMKIYISQTNANHKVK